MDKEQVDTIMATLKERDSIIERQQTSLETLLNRIELLTAAAPREEDGGHAHAPAHVPRAPVKTPEEIHKEKVLNVYQNLQKCQDIKSYKHTMQINVREWIKMFDSRLGILATAIDLKIDSIKDAEYVNLIKSKLDFAVIQELDLKFAEQ